MTKTVEIYIYDLQPEARARLLKALETRQAAKNREEYLDERK